MESRLHILQLEDSLLDADLTQAHLKSLGFGCEWTRVETENQFVQALASRSFDLILADYALPNFDGQSALEIVRRQQLDTPFIFVSGVLGEEVAIDSLRQGATDYVLKSRLQRLGPAVRRAITEQRERQEWQRTEAALREAEKRHEEERGELLRCEQRARTEAEKRAAELVEVNAALARSNSELERFTYAASHDLQEPLRMVKNFTQMLSRYCAGKLDKQAEEMMQIIEKGSDRMQNLINALLSYSRVLHDPEQDHRLMDLNDLLDQTLFSFQTTIDETGATVTREGLPSLRVNAERISLVFQNLLSNALKYQDGSPPQIHVAADQRFGEWIISVRDNGIGFDPQYADRIFGLFKRLHRDDQYPGTGVGLALSKQIVEQHRGRIWAESQPGQGATFFFSLPAERE